MQVNLTITGTEAGCNSCGHVDSQQLSLTADSLAEHGVAFERYAWLAQDERGVWNAPSGTRVAWFKDPDGNLLSIAQYPNP